MWVRCKRILALKAAWAVLVIGEEASRYDAEARQGSLAQGAAVHAAARAARARVNSEISACLRQVYGPIDRCWLRDQSVFPAQLRALSAIPKTTTLMATFLRFLETSQQKLEKVVARLSLMACPGVAADVGLSLYHCFSQVQDATG